METETVIVTALILVAAPLATATGAATDGANESAMTDGANESATWGLCQAQENNRQGNNASNGTVDETPPFANLSEEDCEDAEHPRNQSPGEQGPPDDRPGQGDGDEEGEDEHPDEDENPGDEERRDDEQNRSGQP